MPDPNTDADTTPPSLSEPRTAEPPFDDQDADLIVRSSNMVDYHVYKIILSLSSPRLKSMIAVLQSDSSPPVLDLPEDEHTINYILRCCYPVATPDLHSLEEIRPVLLAATKYDISEVIKAAKVTLCGYVGTDSLGVFAIASHCELYDVCEMAAKEFVKGPLLLGLDPSKLDQISARQYHKLVLLHVRGIDSMPDDRDYWASDNSNPSDPVKTTSDALPRTADAPFNNEGPDTVILYSSDNVQFHVSKAILSYASPFFSDMFSLPQASGSSNHPPVVPVPEDARTIDLLLRICYPILKPSLTDLRDLRLVLDAARKYDMPLVTNVATVALIQCVDQDILGTFAIAVHCELRDVCVAVAKQFLQHPLMSLDSQQLQYISAWQYYQLLRYSQDCSKAASAATSSREWFKEEIFRMDMLNGVHLTSRQCYDCQEHEFKTSFWTAPSQTWRYLKSAEKALQLRPHRSAVMMQETLDNWKPAGIHCKTCDQIYSRDRFSQALADEVDRVLGEVEVPSFF